MKHKILFFYNLIENFDGTKEKLDELSKFLDESPEFINFTGHNLPLLHFSCQTKKPEIVKLLIDKGADVNYKFQGASPLKTALKYGHDDICCLLIENKADPNTLIAKNTSILFYAYKQNKMNIFEALLRNSANTNNFYYEDDAILKAYEDRNEEAFKLLLENGANPEVICKDGKPIFLNAFFNYLRNGSDDYYKKIFKLLIEKNDYRDCNINGYSMLFYAVKYEKNDMVELLLINGFNPNQISKEGFLTPLHLSLQTKNLRTSEILLEYGADANIKSLRGINSVKSVNNYVDTSLLIQDRANSLSSATNFATCGQQSLAQNLTPTHANTEASEYLEGLNLMLFRNNFIVNPKIYKTNLDEQTLVLHEFAEDESLYSTEFKAPKTIAGQPKCQDKSRTR